MRWYDWRRALIYTHRWLGIAGCIVIIVWFASGVVMMYHRMPRLTAEERLMRLVPLDLTALRTAPADAIQRAGLTPERLRIGMLGDRPVYRVLSQGKWTTIYADTGQPLSGVTSSQAVDIIRRFAPEHASTLQHAGRLVGPDQWTLDGGLSRLIPMHRIALRDPADTYFYVSERTGEAVLKTTLKDRVWGYLGPVLHWTYFTPFRKHSKLWGHSIIYFALGGCVMCVVGLATGIWRYSLSRRYRLNGLHAHSPYSGLMWWHHYGGLIFGVVTFTWLLSGALSIDRRSTAPTHQQVTGLAGGPFQLERLTITRIRNAVAAITPTFVPKEVEVLQFRGELVLMAYRSPSNEDVDPWSNPGVTAFLSPELRIDHRLVSIEQPARGVFTRFSDDAVLAAARAAMPGALLEDAVWLRTYDAYYYDRNDARPLPVLRVRYADPEQTWLYLDPLHGRIVLQHNRFTRADRWLYHGLHSLDFPFLYHSRPLWDVVVIVLSLGGLLVSASPIVAIWHRLRRHTIRFARLALAGSGVDPTLSRRVP